jgi:hypothetical protein
MLSEAELRKNKEIESFSYADPFATDGAPGIAVAQKLNEMDTKDWYPAWLSRMTGVDPRQPYEYVRQYLLGISARYRRLRRCTSGWYRREKRRKTARLLDISVESVHLPVVIVRDYRVRLLAVAGRPLGARVCRSWRLCFSQNVRGKGEWNASRLRLQF